MYPKDHEREDHNLTFPKVCFIEHILYGSQGWTEAGQYFHIRQNLEKKNGLKYFCTEFTSSFTEYILQPHGCVHQASLSITNFQSLPKLMSIELVMPSNHLILCRTLLLLPSIFPSIRVFSNESALHIRWPKYWSFSFKISPSNEHSGLISFRMDWLDLYVVQGTLKVFSNTTVQKHQFFSAQFSLWSNSHIHT